MVTSPQPRYHAASIHRHREDPARAFANPFTRSLIMSKPLITLLTVCTLAPLASAQWTDVSTIGSLYSDWTGVAHGNGTFVAVGSRFSTGKIIYSSDGFGWTQATLPSTNILWKDVEYGTISPGVEGFSRGRHVPIRTPTFTARPTGSPGPMSPPPTSLPELASTTTWPRTT